MRSIRSKLWVGMMILVAVMLLLLWLLQIIFLENIYTTIHINRVKAKGYEVIRQITTEGVIQPGNLIDEFSHLSNAYIEIIDAEGKILYRASLNVDGQTMNMFNRGKNEIIRTIFAGGEKVTEMTHPRFSSSHLLMGLPIETDGSILGAFLISFPLAPVEETAEILKSQLALISAILLLVALVISFILARSFTRPLLKIHAVTEQMEKGDYTGTIRLKNKDEIGNLARSINNLSGRLAVTENLRKELVANVSHELRTPLSLIRGYAETLRDVTGDNPEKRQGQLDIIIDESDRLKKIVDDILDLSQIQAGSMLLQKGMFSLSQVLGSVAGKFHVLCESKGLSIREDFEEDKMVLADRKRVEQVLYNLMGNAIAHSGKGMVITVRAYDKDKKTRVEIIDQGKGISPEDLPFIWDRYYKGSGAKGMGLGLTIVKGIFEAHRMEYGVSSTEGSGSTFWFEI
ncbi:MAG: histidine kinase dimerization/phospho-acceptor domain-containing protein [Clostridia bacterium]